MKREREREREREIERAREREREREREGEKGAFCFSLTKDNIILFFSFFPFVIKNLVTYFNFTPLSRKVHFLFPSSLFSRGADWDMACGENRS